MSYYDNDFRDYGYVQTSYTTDTYTSPALAPIAIIVAVLLSVVLSIVIFFICRCCCGCCRYSSRGRVISLPTETALSAGQSDNAYPTSGSYIPGDVPAQYTIGASYPVGATAYHTGGAPYPIVLPYPNSPLCPSNATELTNTNAGEHLYPCDGLMPPVSKIIGGKELGDDQLPLLSLQ